MQINEICDAVLFTLQVQDCLSHESFWIEGTVPV